LSEVPETPVNSGLAFLTIYKMCHFVERASRRRAGKGKKPIAINRPIEAHAFGLNYRSRTMRGG
jgi:hypothetical protein